jgi:hypothetical protein
MANLLKDAQKQRVPLIAIYSTLENEKLMLKVVANCGEAIMKQLWGQVFPLTDAAIETAAKALAATEGQNWDGLDDGPRAAFLSIARTAVTAAYRAHAPKLPAAEPTPIIKPA